MIKNGEVKSITVSSLPEGNNYNFSSSKKIQKLVDHFNNLHLSEDFEENPNEYIGSTWVIEFEYSDNTVYTLYHFGNMFIRSENSKWFKMEYAEAAQFELLLPLNEG